uniref:Uncharacterized protein n=1 Tax=Anguilla anguilla TaxID=7936 RepID=A0A0E9X7Q2_ANGAN
MFNLTFCGIIFQTPDFAFFIFPFFFANFFCFIVSRPSVHSRPG